MFFVTQTGYPDVSDAFAKFHVDCLDMKPQPRQHEFDGDAFCNFIQTF